MELERISGAPGAVSGGHESMASATSFLIEEAELLDEWRLTEWLGLFTPDARYTVDPLQRHLPAGGSASQLFLIADDYVRLEHRVHQLLTGAAYAERPRSRTRRLLTNIRLSSSALPDVAVKANFVVYQFRNGESWEFVGTLTHRLRLDEGGYRIVKRAVHLDHESMNQQRRISIIL